MILQIFAVFDRLYSNPGREGDQIETRATRLSYKKNSLVWSKSVSAFDMLSTDRRTDGRMTIRVTWLPGDPIDTYTNAQK